jgi:tRNA (guanosine-2'-O-)-methyltransferase
MTPERLARLREALDRRQPDLTVVMDRTHKSQNVAAVMRTCDAVGVHRIHAVAVDAIRTHHMVAGGVTKWMKIVRHRTLPSALQSLQRDGFDLLAADMDGSATDYREIDYTRPCALILGRELYGIAPEALEHATMRVSIPMQGLVESLNVSVAAAVILFEARRQREAAGQYAGPSRLDSREYDHTLFEWAYPRIARRCRSLGRPYPALRGDGQLTSNPLADLEPSDPASAASTDRET